MNLQLIHTKVLELTFENLEQENADDKKVFNLDYHNQFDKEEKNLFHVIFDILVIHSNEFRLKCKYAACFKTSTAIDDDFKNSDFPIINAPAIAFPFLRSFISNITLNSGYNPAILPSINFINHKK